ncbi:MAG: AbrB/MazE/SpoVT family DNA-binding domain-containing protein [Acidobacteriota bacterium]
MAHIVTIDQAGRILLPKAVRERLALAPGRELEVESEGERISLRPRRATASIEKKSGVWVLRTGETLTAEATNAILRTTREERDRAAMGNSE